MKQLKVELYLDVEQGELSNEVLLNVVGINIEEGLIATENELESLGSCLKGWHSTVEIRER